MSKSEKIVVLGHDETEVVVLQEVLTLPRPTTHSAGLYHYAILYSTQSHLADVLRKIVSRYPELYQGSADHLVSEAFYFTDPEGNGVELYYDREPRSWKWQDGRVAMASLPLDIGVYILRHKRAVDHVNIKPGHVHLKVGSISHAKEFYVKTMGMVITAEMPSALFVSDGIYHHTFGMNTWESEGVGKRENTLGLRRIELNVFERDDLARLVGRLDKARIEYNLEHEKLVVADPWGNEIDLKVQSH